jgi:hypothetical protein
VKMGKLGANKTPNVADYCSRSGAQALADRIKKHWEARGLPVLVQVVHAASSNAGQHAGQGSFVFGVRSNIVNYPRPDRKPVLHIGDKPVS